MSAAQRRRERDAGAKWFNSLSCGEKWDIGDELVLGAIDWLDWGVEKAPSAGFIAGADEARLFWEVGS